MRYGEHKTVLRDARRRTTAAEDAMLGRLADIMRRNGIPGPVPVHLRARSQDREGNRLTSYNTDYTYEQAELLARLRASRLPYTTNTIDIPRDPRP